MRHLTIGLLAVLLIPLAGCRSNSDAFSGGCDDCARTEANTGTGGPFGGNAAAAAASARGPSASQSPANDETARINPVVFNDRGPGDILSVYSPTERRETASGAAQNISVTTPTSAAAQAQAGGGARDPLMVSLVKHAEALQTEVVRTMVDPNAPPERLPALSAELDKTVALLMEARELSTASHVTRNDFRGSRNMVVGFSTTKTGDQPAIDPRNVAPIAQAAGQAATGSFLTGGDTLEDAAKELARRKQAAADALRRSDAALEAVRSDAPPAPGPDDPPAGPATPNPQNGGG